MQGIYSYTNTVNGKVYVGQSIDIDIRPIQHEYALKIGIDSPHFQRAVDKYGFDKFVYEEIVCGPFDKEELTELEQFYMNKYREEGKELYNIRRAETKDSLSKETRKKMSEAGKAKIFSEAHKSNISISKIGNKSRTGLKNSEHQKQIMKGNKYTLGRNRSEKEKIQISKNMKQYWMYRKGANGSV